jgi:glutamyl-tRNA synthetase
MSNVRVRFAPSPTGSLHVGNARTALFNWLLAKNQGGKMVFRLEDTDVERSTDESKASIIRDITWLGLQWDDGPYLQSERLDIYKEHLNKLEASGAVYKCFCTTDDLALERDENKEKNLPLKYSGKCSHLTKEEVEKNISEGKEFSYRFKVDREEIEFKDLVREDMKFDLNLIGDFVIMRPNGYPTYNFSVVVDDALMGVTHIIRGEDILPSTPKQIMLYEALGYKTPEFGHLSLISGKGGKPLHKRDGATSLSAFKGDGYLPEALFNFLALLGWSPKDDSEIMSKEEIISRFTLKDVSKSPAQFDYEKLKWMNSQYINKLTPEALLEYSEEFIATKYPQFKELDLDKKLLVMQAIAPRIDLLTEASDWADYFYKKFDLDDEAKEIEATEDYDVVKEELIKAIKEETDFSVENHKALIKSIQKSSGRKGKALFMSIRVATTGRTHGPDLNYVFAVIGKEELLKRLA